MKSGADTMRRRMRLLLPACLALLILGSIWPVAAEYADVVLNHNSDKSGVRPVIFPHWFHRIRFRCKVCHHELGFEMRAGANRVTMNDLAQGRFCGMCHDNEVAWGLENCGLCHSGTPGLAGGIHGGHRTLGPGRW